MAMSRVFNKHAWIDNERNSYLDIGDHETASRVKESAGSNKHSVSAESVSFSAGAAGTTGTIGLSYCPIYDSNGSRIAKVGDTSFAWVTGTVLTTEVAYNKYQTDTTQLAAMSNGEFAIDYDTGRLRYKKATTGTSDTCNYTTRKAVVDTELTLEATNVEINNIKVFSPDATALNSKYGFAATDGMTADGTKHAVVMAGYDVTNSKAQHLRQMKGDVAANAGYHLSVAGEVVDFDTGAGTDFTPAIGILGTKSGGTTPIPAGDIVNNSIFVAIGDNTTTAVVETAGTKKALNVNITDGTNDMPTMDAVGRQGYVAITDGTEIWSIDASGYGQIDIAAQSLTAVKISKDANANADTNPIYVEEVVTASSTAPDAFRSTTVDETAAQAVKAGAGVLYGYNIYNPNSYDIFVKLYNVAAASVVIGTTAISQTIQVSALGSVVIKQDKPIMEFTTAISVAATRLYADNDTTSLAIDALVQIYYM